MSIFKHLNTFIDRIRVRMHFDPLRDWLVLISFFFVLLVALVGWNVWAFLNIAGGEAVGSRVDTKAPRSDQTSLESARALFNDHAREDAAYASTTYRYNDPSQ